MGIQLEGTRDPAAAAERADLASFPTRAQVQSAIGELTDDLTALNIDLSTLAGTPNQAAVLGVVRHLAANQKNVMQNQRAILRALAVLVRRLG